MYAAEEFTDVLSITQFFHWSVLFLVPGSENSRSGLRNCDTVQSGISEINSTLNGGSYSSKILVHAHGAMRC